MFFKWLSSFGTTKNTKLSLPAAHLVPGVLCQLGCHGAPDEPLGAFGAFRVSTGFLFVSGPLLEAFFFGWGGLWE